MTLVRLQKFLADCGVASRRKSEQMITLGEVTVNGKVITKLGTKVDPGKDAVKVNGKLLHGEKKGLLLFHKPKHVVSTMQDPEGRPAIADYLGERYESYYPVGRLDFESSGLMIITNDGEFANRLLHPRFGFDRVYQVKVRGLVTVETIKKFEHGIRLDDGLAKAKVKIIESGPNSTWLRVVIGEGRNRLVRRMMDQVGHAVVKLIRVAHGPFELGKLAEGQLKVVKYADYMQAREIVFAGMAAAPKKAPRQKTKR